MKRRQFLKGMGGTLALLGTNLATSQIALSKEEFKPASFSRNKAVEYALKYAQSNNPHFPIAENDCMNFVSQCLYSAGFPMSDPLFGWWSAYGLHPWTKNVRGNHQSRVWNNSASFYDQWMNINQISLIRTFDIAPRSDPSLAKDVQAGDIIQCDWGQGKGWEHTMIVNRVERFANGGKMYVSQHNPFISPNTSFSESTLRAYMQGKTKAKYRILRVNY